MVRIVFLSTKYHFHGDFFLSALENEEKNRTPSINNYKYNR